MKLIADYVEEVKEKIGVKSDRQVGLHLGAHANLVSGWVNEGKRPDDYYCIRMAEILGINPLEIIAAANWEREKSQDRKDWWEDFRRAQSKERGTVLPVFALILLTAAVIYSSNLCILCKATRRKIRLKNICNNVYFYQQSPAFLRVFFYA